MAERVYRALAQGNVEMPPKPGVHPREGAFIHAMPAFIRTDDVVAIKWIAGYPGNKQIGLPYISGLIVLNEASTGRPVAVMDAVEITSARTAAASGLCIRHCAPSGWRTAAVIGCGEQGRYHARALSALNPEATIHAYDRHPERIAQLAGQISAAQSPSEAIADAEVIVTALPMDGQKRSIFHEWPSRARLVLPVDFDASVDRRIPLASDVFLVDDVAQFHYFMSLGFFAGWPEPTCSIGEALVADDPLGYAKDSRIVCCHLGVGALDAMFGNYAFREAVRRGVGTHLPV